MPEHPEKDWNMEAICHPLAGTKRLPHAWATALRVAATLERTMGQHSALSREWQSSRVHMLAHNHSPLQRHKVQICLQFPGTPWGRTAVDTNIGSLQSLVYTEVEMV